MEQLCAEGRQLSKYWVVGRWDVGVEDRHANGGKKALDPNLHSLFLIPKQIGGTNGPPPISRQDGLGLNKGTKRKRKTTHNQRR